MNWWWVGIDIANRTNHVLCLSPVREFSIRPSYAVDESSRLLGDTAGSGRCRLGNRWQVGENKNVRLRITGDRSYIGAKRWWPANRRGWWPRRPVAEARRRSIIQQPFPRSPPRWTDARFTTRRRRCARSPRGVADVDVLTHRIQNRSLCSRNAHAQLFWKKDFSVNSTLLYLRFFPLQGAPKKVTPVISVVDGSS